MNEEKQEGPKWLKELEEKRERRLKVRLGHETGAGSPCLTCENKCPGLDLHFWRKICKNCKCGKENHDVNDDDIYGWAQFQLLGSKPNKVKKIVLPGRKDAVELEWAPKGQSDIVDTYLKEVPINLLPIKGSPAAQERKQLLQKQIPLHDIDPTLCHALSENEIKQMNDYIAHVKQNSVGMGHILKLNEILKNRLINPQYRTKRTPMQLSQSQLQQLQGMDRANILRDPHFSDLQKNLNELHLSKPTLQNAQQNMRYPNQPVVDVQSSLTGTVRDLTYPAYHSSDDVSVFNDQLQYSKLISYPGHEAGDTNFSNRTHQINPIKDLHAQLQTLLSDMDCSTQLYPNHPIPNTIDNQNPTQAGIKSIHAEMLDNVMYPSNRNHPASNRNDEQTPVPTGVKNVFAHARDNNSSIRNDEQAPVQTGIKNIYAHARDNNEQIPSQTDYHRHLRDNVPMYSAAVRNDEQFPRQPGITSNHPQTRDNNVVYPDMNVNFKPNPELLNPTKIGNIKDLAYSTYGAYNPNTLNIEEQNLEPVNISVGLINDIEYPMIKTAEEVENEFVPRKPLMEINQSDVLPSCHRCKKMLDVSSLVIGIGHSDALWHVECFKCTGCNQNLADMMYFYHKESEEIYCGRDYAKIRGIPRCQACDELIFVKEYCLAENSTFHVTHFCCFECDKPLAGENYVMEDLQPLCVPCFEMVKAEKCRACSMVIKPDEKGANLNGVHFHANDQCFSCKICKKALLHAELLFKNSNLYCSAPCFRADK